MDRFDWLERYGSFCRHINLFWRGHAGGTSLIVRRFAVLTLNKIQHVLKPAHGHRHQ
jgi:hypothetical protein